MCDAFYNTIKILEPLRPPAKDLGVAKRVVVLVLVPPAVCLGAATLPDHKWGAIQIAVWWSQPSNSGDTGLEFEACWAVSLPNALVDLDPYPVLWSLAQVGQGSDAPTVTEVLSESAVRKLTAAALSFLPKCFLDKCDWGDHQFLTSLHSHLHYVPAQMTSTSTTPQLTTTGPPQPRTPSP